MPGNEGRPERWPGAAETFGGVRDSLATTADKTADLDARCMRCRRPLTVARSVRIGLGPECRKIMLELILAAS